MKKSLVILTLPVLLVGAVAFTAGALLFPVRYHRTVRLREIGEFSSFTNGRHEADSAIITVVEVSDFTCTYCRKAQKALEEITRKYGDSINVWFAPLPRGNAPHRRLLASAYLAASLQNRANEMKYELFKRAPSLPKPGTEPTIRAAATERLARDVALDIGLDTAQFMQDLRSDETRTMLEKTIAEAKRLEISSTPSFIVNGYLARGALSSEGFEQMISRILQSEGKQQGSET